jgi:oligoendopeptidase F
VKKVIAILMIAAFSLSGCNQVPDETNDEIEEKNAVIAELQRRIDILEYELYIHRNIGEEREWQEEKTDQELQFEEFQKWQAAYFQRVREDLMLRSDLIPFEEGYGAWRFFEEHIHVAHGYVFAYADDGHFAAYMVLAYLEEDGDTFAWDLIAYGMAGDSQWHLA